MFIGNNSYTAIGLFITCGLMILSLLATYPATIAYKKGRNFAKWYVFSLFAFPIAFLVAYIINNKNQQEHDVARKGALL